MNPAVPPIPVQLAHLPEVAGLAVPYITAQAPDGRFLFGAVDPHKLAQCLTSRLCQVCGHRLGRPVVLLLRQRDLARQCVSEPPATPSAPPTPPGHAPWSPDDAATTAPGHRASGRA